MKYITVALALLVLVSCRTFSPTDREHVESTIRARFDAGQAAWNRGDIDGYLAGYWDSEKTRWASGGAVVRGKNAISAAFRSRFATVQQMGKIEATNLEIEVLTGRDALAFGHLTHRVGSTERKGIFTVHLRKIAGQWFVVSDHFSTI